MLRGAPLDGSHLIEGKSYPFADLLADSRRYFWNLKWQIVYITAFQSYKSSILKDKVLDVDELFRLCVSDPSLLALVRWHHLLEQIQDDYRSFQLSLV